MSAGIVPVKLLPFSTRARMAGVPKERPPGNVPVSWLPDTHTQKPCQNELPSRPASNAASTLHPTNIKLLLQRLINLRLPGQLLLEELVYGSSGHVFACAQLASSANVFQGIAVKRVKTWTGKS